MAGRYEEAHKDPKGPGDARPTGIQIVDDEGLAGKLTGKVALVTGTSSGIGIDTVDALAYAGMTVFAVARDLKKAESALAHIIEKYGASKIQLVKMDQNSLDSVRAGAKDFLERAPTLENGSGSKQLNLLVCNAGIMALPTRELTADGHEAQFGTNHLAHFLLFQLVKDALLATAAATPEWPSRVVTVSSTGHRGGPPVFGDYNFDRTEYSPWRGYAQAKTANIYMASQIERLYGARGLHALSLHPGGIWTGLQKHVSDEQMKQWKSTPGMNNYMKSTAQGAATTVWAAVGLEWKDKGGKYLEDSGVAQLNDEDGMRAGYKSHAYNQEGEERLWADSLAILGLKE